MQLIYKQQTFTDCFHEQCQHLSFFIIFRVYYNNKAKVIHRYLKVFLFYSTIRFPLEGKEKACEMQIIPSPVDLLDDVVPDVRALSAGAIMA